MKQQCDFDSSMELPSYHESQILSDMTVEFIATLYFIHEFQTFKFWSSPVPVMTHILSYKFDFIICMEIFND